MALGMRDLVARLRLDTTQFNRGMRGVASTLKTVGAALSVASAGMVVAIKGQLNAADQMGQAAQKFGVPVEELSKLAYAAKLSDVSFEGLGTALRVLSTKMANTPQAFKALGIEVAGADGRLRPVSEVMADLSDIFATMPDGAEKTALAVQFLGKSGTEMIPMLNGGRAGLKALMDEAARFGLVYSPETAAAANQFNDNLDRMVALMQGVAAQIVVNLAPMLSDLSDTLVAVSAAFAELSPKAREWLAILAVGTIVLGPMVIGLGFVVGTLGRVARAFAALTAVMLANPILVTIGLIAAGAVLIWYNWDWLSAKFKAIMTAIAKTATDAWTAIRDKVTDVIAAIEFKWGVWKANFEHLLDTVPQLFTALWEKVKGVVAGWVDDFIALGGQIVDGLKKGISDKWDALVAWFREKVDGMTQGVKDLLGIQSPSKVFAEVGGFISAGLQMGIEGGLGGIQSALGRVGAVLKGAGEEWQGVFKDVGDTIRSSFVGAVTGQGGGLRSGVQGLLSGWAGKLAGSAFDGLAGLFGFARGGVFSGGRVQAFAKGGIVSATTAFGMQGGLGVMGESGPEAIMPLTRGRDGKLGVRGGGLTVTVTMDASTATLGAYVSDTAGRIVARAAPRIAETAVQQAVALSRETGAFK